MDEFLAWIMAFGENAQAEARAQGCADYEMDEFLESAFIFFIVEQRGELDIQDKVRYGNLNLSDE